jgi:methionine biosynthesis protein MetW
MKPADTAYWNQFWEGPDVGLQWKHLAAAELVDTDPVLDIGCGSGLLLELLRDKGLRSLTGCDISSSSTEILASKGLSALRCDVERPLPMRSESFATASLVDVLEHTFYPERLLAEAARVAREVVIVVPNFNSIVARLQVLAGRVPENNTPRKQHVTWFNRRKLEQVVSSAGLEIAAERFHTFKYNHQLFAAPCRMLGAVRPSLFSLAFAVRLHRKR